jgi:8-oxo-dGTP pyrophosphatase MutT (NUDIX family)
MSERRAGHPERGEGSEEGASSAKRGKSARKRRKVRQETSAGGVVIRRDGSETLFLIIRDSYRKWGFPKGHLKDGEAPERAAVREVAEETGLNSLQVRFAIESIDWHFRFRGRQIHKVCHFYLMETAETHTKPQRSEGITACRWVPYDEATRLISYVNAKAVLERAHALLHAVPQALPQAE